MADKNIKITISNRRAIVEGSPVIVCGNSGYTVTFTFDDEWNLTGTRTARFVYVKDGGVHHEDVVFSGDVVAVPVLSDVAFVKVGVFAGDLQTTTPARINCELSILCGSGKVEEPTPDVYNQIMELFNEMAEKGAFGATEEQMQRVAANEEAIQALKTGAVLAGDAEKLGGQLPEHYATAQSVEDLEEATAESFEAIEDGTTKVGDAKKLGGQLPSYYATAQNVADLVSGTTPAGKAGNADTVNGFKVYKSLSELGLDEATATAEAIVTAMIDNSTLLHKLGGTATSAPIQFPYNYSTLRVTKLSSSYVVFECIGTGNLPVYYAYYNGGSANKWSGWGTQCLPLTGGILTGDPAIKKTNPTLKLDDTASGGMGRLIQSNGTTAIQNMNSSTDFTTRRQLSLYNSSHATYGELAKAIQLFDIVSDKVTAYTVHHDGNSQKVTITSGKDVPPSTMEGLWAY